MDELDGLRLSRAVFKFVVRGTNRNIQNRQPIQAEEKKQKVHGCVQQHRLNNGKTDNLTLS